MLAGLGGEIFDGLDDDCDPTYGHDGAIGGDDYFDELRGDYEDAEGELDEGGQKQSPKRGASVSELRAWVKQASDMAELEAVCFTAGKLVEQRGEGQRVLYLSVEARAGGENPTS